MSDKSFNEQAAVLVEGAVNLIRQVLVKHSAAVLEEMRDQIVARNDRIAALEAELNTIHALAMNPQDTAPREGDMFTLALLRQLLALRAPAHASEQAEPVQEAISVADIERQIDHIQQNGVNVAKFGSEYDIHEGRCRELCAMYLREFIETERQGKRLAALIAAAPPAEAERESEYRAALQAVLDTRNAEATAELTMRNAATNYGDSSSEAALYYKAAASASAAEKTARDMLATISAPDIGRPVKPHRSGGGRQVEPWPMSPPEPLTPCMKRDESLPVSK